jgi:hypothetical protein
MNVMRFTIIDAQGAVSFVAHCEALAALVAGCAKGANDLDELLQAADRHYPSLREYVLSGLAVFSEHNANGNYECIHSAFRYCPPTEMPVFRVVDDETRKVSLNPVKAGLIIFNFVGKRIVQVQNSYAEIEREGRVRIYDGLTPTNRVLRYHLPKEWALVP